MNVVTRGIMGVVMALIFLLGCSESNNQSNKEESTLPATTPSSPAVTTSPSTPAHAAAPFDATIYISDDFPGERWLPTQFAPRLVGGESVSLLNKWPLDGDTIRVLCQTKGEPLQDITGTPSSLWYGILVPNNKATRQAHDGRGVEAEVTEGGYIGYVGWFALADITGTPPSC